MWERNLALNFTTKLHTSINSYIHFIHSHLQFTPHLTSFPFYSFPSLSFQKFCPFIYIRPLTFTPFLSFLKQAWPCPGHEIGSTCKLKIMHKLLYMPHNGLIIHSNHFFHSYLIFIHSEKEYCSLPCL